MLSTDDDADGDGDGDGVGDGDRDSPADRPSIIGDERADADVDAGLAGLPVLLLLVELAGALLLWPLSTWAATAKSAPLPMAAAGAAVAAASASAMAVGATSPATSGGMVVA